MRLQWRGWIAALAMSVGVFAQAQDASQAAANVELTGVAHVAVRVTDIDAEVAFLGKLGFEKAWAVEHNGKVAFNFVKVNDEEFIEVHPSVAPDGTPQPLGFNHICFATNGAKALHDRWAATGLNPTDAAKGPDGTLEFGAKDPEGRVTEALEFLPGSQPALDKGRHLGVARVSKFLMGVDLPAVDVAASRKFFEAVGFVAAGDGNVVRLSAPGHPEVRVVLRPAANDAKAQLLFAVNDADKAAAALSAAGLKVEKRAHRVIVRDPDGTAFVFAPMRSRQAE
jgi:catechol 2,3-dioxygenase-like lactoylglutathione lyase family enzyme